MFLICYLNKHGSPIGDRTDPFHFLLLIVAFRSLLHNYQTSLNWYRTIGPVVLVCFAFSLTSIYPQMSNRINTRNKGQVLLLGMFFSSGHFVIPNRGQGFRDNVRCQALEDQGYTVLSLDDKHDEDDYPIIAKKHCKANFADARRMMLSLRERWGTSYEFDHIILDYFFSPVSTPSFLFDVFYSVYNCPHANCCFSPFFWFQCMKQAGWARTRWTDNFFKETIPRMALDHVIRAGGRFWLPNLKCVADALVEFKSVIEEHYEVEYIAKPEKNPLYSATEQVERELLRCPDKLTNETQMRPLLDHSAFPFIVLRRRQRPLSRALEGEFVPLVRRVAVAVGPAAAYTGSASSPSLGRRARPVATVTPSSSQESGRRVRPRPL